MLTLVLPRCKHHLWQHTPVTDSLLLQAFQGLTALTALKFINFTKLPHIGSTKLQRLDLVSRASETT